MEAGADPNESWRGSLVCVDVPRQAQPSASERRALRRTRFAERRLERRVCESGRRWGPGQDSEVHGVYGVESSDAGARGEQRRGCRRGWLCHPTPRFALCGIRQGSLRCRGHDDFSAPRVSERSGEVRVCMRERASVSVSALRPAFCLGASARVFSHRASRRSSLLFLSLPPPLLLVFSFLFVCVAGSGARIGLLARASLRSKCNRVLLSERARGCVLQIRARVPFCLMGLWPVRSDGAPVFQGGGDPRRPPQPHQLAPRAR